MKDPQATLRDIALKLGLSISTVSRALRGVTEISPETKQAVLDMAHKLNYEPNRIAQSLRMKRTNTIGVVVPEIAMHFFSVAISGIQEYAISHNFSTIICQSMESFETEKSNIHMLVSNRIDGLIISLSSETSTYNHLEELIVKKIPLVLFDRVSTGLNVSKVTVDDHDGAYKAVDYLVKIGCKRIGYLTGSSNLYISQQREMGYTDALVNNSLKVDCSLIIHCDDLRNDLGAAIEKMVSLNPDAIFCMNDPIAIKAMQYMKERGIRVPEDISIIGFTNEPISSFIEPSLTTISQPSGEMGRAAAELLIEQITSHEELKPQSIRMQTELIIRNSTRKA